MVPHQEKAAAGAAAGQAQPNFLTRPWLYPTPTDVGCAASTPGLQSICNTHQPTHHHHVSRRTWWRARRRAAQRSRHSHDRRHRDGLGLDRPRASERTRRPLSCKLAFLKYPGTSQCTHHFAAARSHWIARMRCFRATRQLLRHHTERSASTGTSAY